MSGGDDRDHINRALRTLQHCALYRRTIKLTCPACGHVRRYDAVPLWWMFHRKGWNDHLPLVLQRFYCAPCNVAGRRVRPRYLITRDQPDPGQPPYPDKTTWRQLVSRYRS